MVQATADIYWPDTGRFFDADLTGAPPNNEEPAAPEAGPESEAAPAPDGGGGAGGGDDLAMGQPTEKRRRRPALSCEQCRRRKIRCDRSLPCANCVRSHITPCSYAATHIPQSRASRRAAAAAASASAAAAAAAAAANAAPQILPARSAPVNESPLQQQRASTSASASAPQSPPHQGLAPARASSSSVPSSVFDSVTESTEVTAATTSAEALAARVRVLEQKLADNFHISPLSGREDRLYPSNDEPENHEGDEEGEPAPMKGTVSKTRFFGQSHWMNGADLLLPTILGIVRRRTKSDGDSELTTNFQKCKALARAIKDNRFQALDSTALGKSLPARALADQLVERYLANFEGVLRILHVPTFRTEMDRYWETPDATSEVFTMQLQLVLALGASLHDDTFALRAQASRWTHEAQMWLMLPPEKRRMTIAGIQIMCLVAVAKSVCAVGQDLVWVTAGTLVRQAMYMGLHRDPARLGAMSVFRAEMRRRLWATIVELNLQASLDAGGPALLSPRHYDTRPPADLDDADLGDGEEAASAHYQQQQQQHQRQRQQRPGAAASGRPGAPSSQQQQQPPPPVTDMSVPLALLRSQPLRLAIVKHINEFRSHESYQETLRLNSELTRACRTLAETLAALSATPLPSAAAPTTPLSPFSASASSSNPKVASFHTSLVQMFVYRCFMALHQPLLARSLEDPAYCYSRKVALDCALKLAHVCHLSEDLWPADRAASDAGGGILTPFERLVTNGAGTFRLSQKQPLFTIAMELVKKKEEQRESFDGQPPVGCAELQSVIRAALGWSERRVRSGETNIKGLVFVSSTLGIIDAIERRLTQEAMEHALFDECTRSSRLGLELLRERAISEGVAVDVDAENFGKKSNKNNSKDKDKASASSSTSSPLIVPPQMMELEESTMGPNFEDVVGMDFDWMAGLGWDNMGGYGVPLPMGPVGDDFMTEMDSVDPSVMSQF